MTALELDTRRPSAGRLPFAHPTLLAPMEGVTHPTFRAWMAERGGLGCVCTEFVRVTDTPYPPSVLAREVVKAPGVPLSVQVMGRDATRMAEAAAAVSELGAEVVDINLGCPTKKAVAKGVGAAMLRDPDLLYEVLSTMRPRVTGLLSAKIRAGFDDASHVVHIGRTVQAAGADFIAVHPRRRVDFYEGVADWRIIRVLRERLSIPVVGNGDCWYAADALRMQEETGCDAVMIGRGAMRNPWIFEQVAALRAGAEPPRPGGAQVVALLHDIAARYGDAFGDKARIGRLKELVRWLGRAVDDGRRFRTAVLRAKSVEEMLRIAEAQLASLPATRFDLDAAGSLRLERSGHAGPTATSRVA